MGLSSWQAILAVVETRTQPSRTRAQPVIGGADLHDESLAAVVHLTGDGARPMLAAAAEQLGATLRSVRIDQVSHEPARRCTVSYSAELDWGTHARTETMVATTSVDGPPSGAAILEADGLSIGLWRYPFDPELPGLVDAVMPDRLQQLLGRLLPGPLESTVLTYRPGRRAVVHVAGASGELYLKVLRPSRSVRLAQVHETLFDQGVPVPELLYADNDRGVLVLRSLGADGSVVPLRSCWFDGGDRTQPVAPARSLAPMIERLARCRVGDRPARRRPLNDVAAHFGVLGAVLPDASERLAELHERLRPDESGDPAAIRSGVTVHGDLHDGQIMVGPNGDPIGLLDLDDVGVGSVADDLGSLLGHTLTLATAAPRGILPGEIASVNARIIRWARGVGPLADRLGVDRDEVDRRAAAAAVSLATGPFRVREPDWRSGTTARLAVAEALLDRVEQRRARVSAAPRWEQSQNPITTVSSRWATTEPSPRTPPTPRRRTEGAQR